MKKRYNLTNKNISSFKSIARIFGVLSEKYNEKMGDENNNYFERKYTTQEGGEIKLRVHKANPEEGTLTINSNEKEIKSIENFLSNDKLLKLEQI